MNKYVTNLTMPNGTNVLIKDSECRTNLSNEINRATKKETLLQQNINAEASAREQADKTLQTKIKAVETVSNENSSEIATIHNDITTIENKNNEQDNELSTLRTMLSSPYNFKGDVASISALPASGEVNDTYYVQDVKYKVTWTGSEWRQSSLSEVDYQTELSEINDELTNVYEECVISKPTDLTGIVNSDGTVTPNTGFARWYIEVKPRTICKINVDGGTNPYSFTCEYDKDNNFIRSLGKTDYNMEFVTSENAKYIGASLGASFASTFVLKQTSLRKTVENEINVVNDKLYENIGIINRNISEISDTLTIDYNSVIVSDNFVRDNSDTLGYADFTSIPQNDFIQGNSAEQIAWNENGFEIFNNSAKPNTTNSIAIVETKMAKCLISVDIYNYENCGIVFGYTDESHYNFIILGNDSLSYYYNNGSGLKLYKSTGINQNPEMCNLSVVTDNKYCYVYLDGVRYLCANIIVNNGTKHGIAYLKNDISNIKAYFKNFVIKKMATPVISLDEIFTNKVVSRIAISTEISNQPHSLTFEKENNENVAKFELRKNDPIVANGKRSEITVNCAELMQEKIYDFYIKLPSTHITDDIEDILVQWHKTKDSYDNHTSPCLSISTKNGNWKVSIAYNENRVTTDNNDLTYIDLYNNSYKDDLDKWVHFTVKVKFGCSVSLKPYIEIYKDGSLIVSYYGPNCDNDLSAPYFKFGIYKYGWNDEAIETSTDTRIVYFKNVSIF